jgi:hypothetical protein
MADRMPVNITIGDKYRPAMTITDQADADAYLARCVEHTLRCVGGAREDAEKIERDNLGYFAGYYNHETRARVERLFSCAHPIFGAIAANGPPTADEALRKGIELGQAAGAVREVIDQPVASPRDKKSSSSSSESV